MKRPIVKRPIVKRPIVKRPTFKRSKPERTKSERSTPERTPRTGRVLLPVLATVLVAGVLVVGVFPTRTFLAQRATVAHADQQLNQLESSNAALRAEAKRLQTDAEIEQQARMHLDYAKPGEEVYHVLPAPQKPIAVPNVWPFKTLQQRLDH